MVLITVVMAQVPRDVVSGVMMHEMALRIISYMIQKIMNRTVRIVTIGVMVAGGS